MIFAKLPRSIIDKLISFMPKLTLSPSVSLNIGIKYLYIKIHKPATLLTAIPITPNINESGYNKTIDTNISTVVEIENFLKSPFP